MDIVEDTKKTYQDFVDLNPKVIFGVSLVGLLITIFFVYIYRKTILDTYGNKAYFWFLFLIFLNIVNMIYISGYYEYKRSSLKGDRGDIGLEGDKGDKGNDLKCGMCSDTDEIALQYSTNYHLVSKINKTTNVLGNVSIWRASGMLGLSYLGDTIFPHAYASKSRTYMTGYGSKQPEDFEKIIDISDGRSSITFWKPIPPKGYSYLGHIATSNSRKPDPSLFGCLPSKCLVEGNDLTYVASFPSIDIIPSFANRNMKYCSFWRTPLNHFYCKTSVVYYTNSLYYNLVDGNPEYYDSKRKLPIANKLEEIKRLLQDKPSVVQHISQTSNTKTRLNTTFMENIRDDKGNIIETKIHGETFNKFINRTTSIEKYLEHISEGFIFIDNLINNSIHKITFVNDDTRTDKNPFTAIKNKLDVSGSGSSSSQNKSKSRNQNTNKQSNDNFNKFILIFRDSPALVIKMFQDPSNSFGVGNKKYMEMTLDERKIAVNSILNILKDNEVISVLRKLNSIGVDVEKKTKDILANHSKNIKKNANNAFNFETTERVNPDLTLWDDLFYLFPAGLDEQIAETEEDTIEGGYYLEALENRQRKNFFDYIKTFIKPNLPSYSFKKQCVMFIDIDDERNKIIADLISVYEYLEGKLTEMNKFESCDNTRKLERVYNHLMKKIDIQFRSIEGYQDKIRNREFSYFPTSRLKWLLNEMNNYYADIKENCKSDNRTRIISQIKNTNKQLKEELFINVDLTQYDIGLDKKNRRDKQILDTINKRIENMDVDDIKLNILININNVLDKILIDKLDEIKKKRQGKI